MGDVAQRLRERAMTVALLVLMACAVGVLVVQAILRVQDARQARKTAAQRTFGGEDEHG